MGHENFRSHPDLDADQGIFEGIFTVVALIGENSAYFADNTRSFRQILMKFL